MVPFTNFRKYYKVAGAFPNLQPPSTNSCLNETFSVSCCPRGPSPLSALLLCCCPRVSFSFVGPSAVAKKKKKTGVVHIRCGIAPIGIRILLLRKSGLTYFQRGLIFCQALQAGRQGSQPASPQASEPASQQANPKHHPEHSIPCGRGAKVHEKPQAETSFFH